jgi:branched-chain amino acid transport system substrate-binding protein
MARWLKASSVNSILRKQRFDHETHYGDDLYKVRQIQDGRWVVVWPKQCAAPDASLIYPRPRR